VNYRVLRGKTIVLGVSGSIAAYRAADLIRRLQEQESDVHVIMTKNACQFITPLTMQALSQNPVRVDMFDLSSERIGHIETARMADIIVVAPATANIMAKAASGIADDYLSTVLLATKSPVLFCPAMNPAMYSNVATQGNIKILRERGFHVIEPETGPVACGEAGRGRFPAVDRIVFEIASILSEKSLAGVRIMVSAGPTREFFDPVRFISNPSSGKMGYALAEAARLRGANVHLISGPVSLEPPPGVNVYKVVSAIEMREVARNLAPSMDIIIMAAAVGDYRPKKVAPSKIKKKLANVQIELVQNPDILAELGKEKGSQQVLIGFAAETTKLVEHAKEKLRKKNLDLIIANDVTKPGSGFCYDTNQVKILYRDGVVEDVPPMSKLQVADRILDIAGKMLAEKRDESKRN